MRIRRATIDDAPALVPLFAAWGYPQPAERIAARLPEWEGPQRALLVAEAVDDLAGFVAVCTTPHLALPGVFGRVIGLAVGPAHRRRGVGAALLDAAEALGREWGCDRMEITTSRLRPEASHFYAARGYDDRCGRSARFIRPL